MTATGVVQVYLNIHRTRAAGRPVYSIRDKATRRVVSHSDRVALEGARFVVSEPGRQRVLKEKRKNVHAWVEGTLCDRSGDGDTAVRVGYNPYLGGSFFQTSRTKGSLGAARTAELVELGRWVLAWGVKGDAE